MTTNKIALAILKNTHKFLTHENQRNFTFASDFLCCAIDYSNSRLNGLFVTSEIVSQLQAEVSSVIGGANTLNGFLHNTFGEFDGDMSLAVTQPIRRAILNKLIAKYQALVDAEDVETKKAIQDKIDVLKIVKAEQDSGSVFYVCVHVSTITREHGLDKTNVVKSITADIGSYIGGYVTMREYLSATGKPCSSEDQKQARKEMVVFLIAKYEKELADVQA